MMHTHAARVAKALSLAGNPFGVTVTDLALVLGITRQSAHAILVQLEEAGELTRSIDPTFANRHIYRISR